MLILKATKRQKEDIKEIRLSGQVPAVFYGFGKESTPIYVPKIEFTKLFKEAGETTAITLDTGAEKISVLIHEIQRDPIKGDPIHVDFLVVDMNKEISVSVPLEFTGVAEAEKNGIGMVVKVLHEIEVKALPSDLPHSITIDITNLSTLSDSIYAKDLSLPKGVSLVTDQDEAVVAITSFAEEKETPNLDVSAIEVEKKGKKEEDSQD